MSFLMPDLMLDSVLQITPDLLESLNVSGIILDVDSTLADHNGHIPYKGVAKWLDSMKAHGIKMIILSNNSAERVAPFADSLKLSYTASGAKPFPKGVLRAAEQMGLCVHSTVVVGDQIYTDIMAGNLAKAKTILLPVPSIKENLFFRFKRLMEKPVRNAYIKKHGGNI